VREAIESGLVLVQKRIQVRADFVDQLLREFNAQRHIALHGLRPLYEGTDKGHLMLVDFSKQPAEIVVGVLDRVRVDGHGNDVELRIRECISYCVTRRRMTLELCATFTEPQSQRFKWNIFTS
jgi:hypothetical protein